MCADGDDFEEAFSLLRVQLDEHHSLLLCNRFRRNALATSLSRQMSNGLSCYLVEPGIDLDPELLVDCLGPAPFVDVVEAEEARQFLDEWKKSFE